MAILSTKEVRMYLRIRNLCGLLGIILPWIALFSAGIVLNKPEGWWWSISATYYQSPALVGVLVPACIVMMSYIGYDWKDNLITTLTGLFGLGIVLFPCKVDWIADGSAVGFFQLPIEVSQIVHTAIYRICGWGMIGFEALLVVLVLLGAPGWVVMVIEIFLLHLFGFAWLVKGEFFPFLNDKEEEVEESLPEDDEPMVGAGPGGSHKAPKIRMEVD